MKRPAWTVGELVTYTFTVAAGLGFTFALQGKVAGLIGPEVVVQFEEPNSFELHVKQTDPNLRAFRG